MTNTVEVVEESEKRENVEGHIDRNVGDDDDELSWGVRNPCYYTSNRERVIYIVYLGTCD